jgi:aryl sulfotransferase
MYHQGDNIDRPRLRRLTGQPDPDGPVPPRPTLHEWLVNWIDRQTTPQEDMDSLVGVLWHVTDAWERQRSTSNVLLVHYDDLSSDLDGQMRLLAGRLGITVPAPVWPQLVEAATFPRMRARAAELAPNHSGVLKDNAAFFRRGRSGAGREQLSPEEFERYRRRVEPLAPPHVLAWLHRPR